MRPKGGIIRGMASKRPPTTGREKAKRKKLPRFKNENEIAEFFSRHSAVDYQDAFEDLGEPFELSDELRGKIEQQSAARRLRKRKTAAG